MKVYTKKGDKGTTQLIGGTRVPKSSLRIEAYGTVDELNSYIGLLRDQQIDQKHIVQLLEIQDRLFTMGSLLAVDKKGTKMELPKLHESDVTNLEEWIDDLESNLEPMTSFVLPGGNVSVSHTHIARCVCRRAERITVDLSNDADIDPLLLTYLNRLSDYLFVLSRSLTKELNATEIPWKPRM